MPKVTEQAHGPAKHDVCSTEFHFQTQSNIIHWTEFDWVQFVRLSSIGSKIELTQRTLFDFVRLLNLVELDP